MVLRLFIRRNFKNLAVYSICECLLSNATGNSDSQNATLETTENTSTWEVEVSSSVFVKVWSQRLHTHTFRNGLIDSSEVFRLCAGPLAICAQVHH